MRHYPSNGPEAMSRLLALALLVDGGLDRSELLALQRSQVLDQLGIEDSVFHQVTQALCDDLLQCVSTNCSTQLELGHELIDQLLGDVSNPALQVPLLRAMVDIVYADGFLADGEAVLVARAMALWMYDQKQMSPPGLAQDSASRRSFAAN
ncbi:TerB family tellurite resistance protein [Burkholderiaceae bacterium DAT-1]|nr:TerB family tellurite resistance protein [Burkholderiaceae bacterium DAT-1]